MMITRLGTFIGVFMLGCSSREVPLAEIGRFSIMEKDARLRAEVARVYYPENRAANLGALQLKNAFILADILGRNGNPITDEILERESNRIDANTRDPATLGRVKAVFGSGSSFDRSSYRKDFVLPVYVERMIEPIFQALPLHGESHQRALDFRISVLGDPTKFRKRATEMKLETGEWFVSRESGLRYDPGSRSADSDSRTAHRSSSPKIVNQGEKNHALHEEIEKAWAERNDADLDRWFREIIEPTPMNAVVSSVIDQGESWYVLRLKRRTKKLATFDAVRIPKVRFSDWLRVEREKVRVLGSLTEPP